MSTNSHSYIVLPSSGISQERVVSALISALIFIAVSVPANYSFQMLLTPEINTVYSSGKSAYTDEDMHQIMAQRLTEDLTEFTGSRLIAQEITRSLGYLKETNDMLTGSGWSEGDLAAQELGILSAR